MEVSFLLKVAITIISLTFIIVTILVSNKLLTMLERRISKQRLRGYLYIFYLIFMITASIIVANIIQWTLLETTFFLSLCFFIISWFSSISLQASKNYSATINRFNSNGREEYNIKSTLYNWKSPYSLASVTFLLVSWGASFIVYFIL
ncbi:hypothetical protein FIU87_19370 [Bacillus sp. THAF10]|nr:hypothetical protein FIU87_19370 [Bacillus sp. THAF10]